MFTRQNLKYFSLSRSVSEDFSSKLRLAKWNLLIIIFTKHIFSYIIKISRSQATFRYFYLFFKVTVDQAPRLQTHCTTAEIRICACAGPGSGLEPDWALVVEVTSVRVRKFVFAITKVVVVRFLFFFLWFVFSSAFQIRI